MNTSRAVALVLLLALAACGDDTGGAGGGSGGSGGSNTSSPTSTATGAQGGGGEGGSGGGPNLDKDPAEVTSSDDCFYEGEGGDNGFSCDAVTVTFSRTIEVPDLTFKLTTSEGDTFTEADTGVPESGGPYPHLLGHLTQSGFFEPPTAGPVEGIALRDGASGNHDNPTWIEIEVRELGEVVGTARFEDAGFSYVCTAYSIDDWCWEAVPVELMLDP